MIFIWQIRFNSIRNYRNNFITIFDCLLNIKSNILEDKDVREKAWKLCFSN